MALGEPLIRQRLRESQFSPYHHFSSILLPLSTKPTATNKRRLLLLRGSAHLLSRVVGQLSAMLSDAAIIVFPLVSSINHAPYGLRSLTVEGNPQGSTILLTNCLDAHDLLEPSTESKPQKAQRDCPVSMRSQPSLLIRLDSVRLWGERWAGSTDHLPFG
ncbi:hypothetical protein BDV06DRAFT_19318 [Aspergillus oleicola]